MSAPTHGDAWLRSLPNRAPKDSLTYREWKRKRDEGARQAIKAVFANRECKCGQSFRPKVGNQSGGVSGADGGGMSQLTAIEWTDHTFNVAWGCMKVSPGCQHCYADTLSSRYGFDVWGPAATTERRTFGDKHWAEPYRWNKAAGNAGVRRRVFCCSMCDLFEDHPTIDAEREKLWPLIRATPHLDWRLG